MFAGRYFGKRYFAGRYFGEGGNTVTRTSGGAVKVRVPKTSKKPTKKVFTEEELQGLIAFGNAQMGIKKEEKVIESVVEAITESPVFVEETGLLGLINYLPEVIEAKPEALKEADKIKIDDDIALILALVTIHNS